MNTTNPEITVIKRTKNPFLTKERKANVPIIVTSTVIAVLLIASAVALTLSILARRKKSRVGSIQTSIYPGVPITQMVPISRVEGPGNAFVGNGTGNVGKTFSSANGFFDGKFGFAYVDKVNFLKRGPMSELQLPLYSATRSSPDLGIYFNGPLLNTFNLGVFRCDRQTNGAYGQWHLTKIYDTTSTTSPINQAGGEANGSGIDNVLYTN